MSQDTCAVLTAVFPIVLLTVVVDRRLIHLRIRRTRFFRWVSLATVTASLLGLILSVLGVESDGLVEAPAFFGWSAGLVAVAGLAIVLVAALATTEMEEDDTFDQNP